MLLIKNDETIEIENQNLTMDKIKLYIKKEDFYKDVKINGESVSGNITNELKNNLDSLDSIEIGSHNETYIRTMEIMERILDKLTFDVSRISRLFYLNRDSSMWIKLNAFLNDTEILFKEVNTLKESCASFFVDTESISRISQSVEELVILVFKMEDLIKNKDTIAVADHIEWTIKKLVRSARLSISKTKGI